MTGPNGRLDQIGRFVKGRLEQVAAQQQTPASELAYRWQHTLRVASLGQQLAEAEHVDVELAVAACLLHDVASFDPGEPRDHGRLGAEISRPFLLELDYSQEQTEAICYAVASHVDIKDPLGLLAKVVTDADNIDRFAAYRLIVWCGQDIYDFDRLVERVQERLPILQRYRQQGIMETRAGNELFARQLDLQIALFQALLWQKELTRFPRL